MNNPYQGTLATEAERWIKDYDNKEGGTLYDWDDKAIAQFKDVPLVNLLNLLLSYGYYGMKCACIKIRRAIMG